ncbi:TetR/AcrR family transcriptional regulator [Brevibacterium marinum]|uniref:AcrR family transcriptional regulator n=1 Tax=Brevibacterium marinum TaxID=418643 RepID=A0A846RP78_9MICO|nr:TetR/AcrR family transcriptional regulator [Brevibacterium marinum]NJC55714.1 AcrR family transcriptional regulator [Brevibacterium marinum]
MTGSSRGRPRSETARSAILEATRALLIEDGYEDMTVSRIAVRAEVGKQTVYRWWKSKAEIVAEAALNGVIPMEAEQPVATDDLVTDVYTLIRNFTEPANERGGSALIRALASASAASETSGAQLWERFAEPTRAAITQRLAAAVDIGDVRDDVELGSVADALIGSLLLRVLSRQPITSADFEALADVILCGISTGSLGQRSTERSEDS